MPGPYTWMKDYHRAAENWNRCHQKLSLLFDDNPAKAEVKKELLEEASRLVGVLSIIKMSLSADDFEKLGWDPDTLPVAVDIDTGEVVGFAVFHDASLPVPLGKRIGP